MRLYQDRDSWRRDHRWLGKDLLTLETEQQHKSRQQSKQGCRPQAQE